MHRNPTTTWYPSTNSLSSDSNHNLNEEEWAMQLALEQSRVDQAFQDALECGRREQVRRDAIERTGREQAEQEAIDRIQREQALLDEEAIQQAIERSRTDTGVERTTNLAVQLSQNDQEVQKALLFSESEQQERVLFDSTVEEVARLSLQEYRAEKEWAAQQKAVQEESCRAYEEEQDRRDRLWEQELLGGASNGSDPLRKENDHSYHNMDEGYVSAPSHSGSSTPRSTKHSTYPSMLQVPPTAPQLTWQFPAEEVVPLTPSSSTESGCSRISRSGNPRSGSASSGHSRASTPASSISASGAPILETLLTPQNHLEMRPSSLTDVQTAPLAPSIQEQDTGKDHNEPQSSAPITTVIHIRIPSAQLVPASDGVSENAPTPVPQVIHNEHHHHGNIYHQTINNYTQDGNSAKRMANHQKRDPLQTSAEVNGLYTHGEKFRRAQPAPSTGRSKYGLSFVKGLGNRILRKSEASPSGSSNGYRGDDKMSRSSHIPSIPDVVSHNRISQNEGTSRPYKHPKFWTQELEGPNRELRENPPCSWPSRSASEVPDGSRRSGTRRTGLRDEPPHVPPASSFGSDKAYYTALESVHISSASDAGTSFYSALSAPRTPAPSITIEHRGRLNPDELMERLEREAARNPIFPGSYPMSTAETVPSASPSLRRKPVLTANPIPAPAPGPPLPPKLPLAESLNQSEWPEMPGAFHTCSSPPPALTGPEIPFESALPQSFPIQRPVSLASMTSQASIRVNSPTPQRLRLEMGRQFAYRPLNSNLPLVPGPDQDLRNLSNHAIRDLDRHCGGGRMPLKAPVLPKLPGDYPQKEGRAETIYESEDAKAKRLEKERMKMSRAAL
ncbi:hypothetical protein K458DRAFT_437331 [Lentithecium fluviatile CBS 122367]|uniref:Uncharacterized protein n=1 Tax=Lentithecium fluviatile CBS 122367 TaxID=1168545 RepID=A0A6G1IEG1_9PLEO|nr:hypothetical protein K458DRAFT_437331 [Lentithecium fluviatile CBS 122367]